MTETLIVNTLSDGYGNDEVLFISASSRDQEEEDVRTEVSLSFRVDLADAAEWWVGKEITITIGS